LPLFAAAVLPTQIRTLVCRFTGAIMDSEVCCPSNGDDQTPPESQLLTESCCIVKTVDLPKLVSDRRVDSAPAPHHELLPIAFSLETPRLVDRAAQARPVGPPPLGPPIVLLKRSFLI
jgi:hypothetical protein